MDKEKMTKAWQRYEQGRNYNNRLTPNLYDMVNTNIEFFCGNQWLHLNQPAAMQKLPKPVFNIIKRVASMFVASLPSSAASICFAFFKSFLYVSKKLRCVNRCVAYPSLGKGVEKFR